MKHGKPSGERKIFEDDRGGMDDSKHVRQAEEYLSGTDLQGVNVETGWSKKTRYTGDFDKA